MTDHFELASTNLHHHIRNEKLCKRQVTKKFQGTKHTHTHTTSFWRRPISTKERDHEWFTLKTYTHTHTQKAFIKYKLGNAAFLVSLLL